MAAPPKAMSAWKIRGSPPRPPRTCASWLPSRMATIPPAASAWARSEARRRTSPTVSGPRSTTSPVTTSAVAGGAVHASAPSVSPAARISRSAAPRCPCQSLADQTVNSSGMTIGGTWRAAIGVLQRLVAAVDPGHGSRGAETQGYGPAASGPPTPDRLRHRASTSRSQCRVRAGGGPLPALVTYDRRPRVSAIGRPTRPGMGSRPSMQRGMMELIAAPRWSGSRGGVDRDAAGDPRGRRGEGGDRRASGPGPGRRHRRRHRRLQRRVPPDEARLARRRPPRAKAAHLGHDVARRRPR